MSCGVGRPGRPGRPSRLPVVGDDVVADVDALVADEHRRARDELADVVLVLVAERAAKDLAVSRRPLGRHQRSRREITWSTMPYAFAWSASMMKSRSASDTILSSGCFVCWDEDLVQPVLDAQDLLRLDRDVGGLPLRAAPGLVDEDPGVREGEALAVGAGGEEDGAHRGGLADADGLDVGPDELHGVVDRHAGRRRAARAVDVDVDVLLRVLGLEEEELGDDQVGDHVVDRRPDEDDVVLEQARVDVVGPLAAGRLLHDHRDQGARELVARSHFSSTR